MTVRYFTMVFAVVVLATFSVGAQKKSTHEKLYVNAGDGDTNNLSIFDVATGTLIKRMTVGKHPHGVASPRGDAVLYIASETEGTVTKLDTIKDEVITTYGGFGVEPQESDITPDGRFLY